MGAHDRHTRSGPGAARRAARWAALAGAALVAGAAGCSPDLGEAPFLCAAGTPLCPEGYQCVAGADKRSYCVKEGTCPATVPGCVKDTTPGVCGNGRCEWDESERFCPQDCKGAKDGGVITLDTGVTPDKRVKVDSSTPPGKFGDVCNSTVTKPCETGLTCVRESGVIIGYCSKACTNTGKECTGAPGQTRAFCITPGASGGYYCAFLCRLGTTTAPCPSKLVCSTSPSPPGSSQYLCEVL